MGLINMIWWSIFYGTVGYFAVLFLVATNLIPGDGGILLSGFGYVFLVILAFVELVTIKL